ncbi:Mitomycin resistance protein [Candidatus Desulfarcum epimagneticum]|uniref:Mitomycin resistance protein n=1 Tax=uncultured Desulfobacteraceae bacterium TaxID=218296 RepID=A0A484HN33_9BACT|nr:Mitomycin resistance protein [uncultured Desulfobacteraceae bacterium]
MTNRTDIKRLNKIPNVGPATTKRLNMLGIQEPFELIGQNPYSMFEKLCEIAGRRFDPCLADVFISAVRFMEGAPPKKWWEYTKERKAAMSKNGRAYDGVEAENKMKDDAPGRR